MLRKSGRLGGVAVSVVEYVISYNRWVIIWTSTKDSIIMAITIEVVEEVKSVLNILLKLINL